MSAVARLSRKSTVSTCHREIEDLTSTATQPKTHIGSLLGNKSASVFFQRSLAAPISSDGTISRVPGALFLYEYCCWTHPALGQSASKLHLLVARNHTIHHAPSTSAGHRCSVHLVPAVLYNPSLASVCVRKEICTSDHLVVGTGSGH